MPDQVHTIPPISEAERDKLREKANKPIPREHRKVGGQVSDLVVDAERVDRDWEDGHAEDRREEWEDVTRPELLGQRRAARKRLTLGTRLDTVARQLEERAGGMRARPIGTTSRSAEGSPTGNRPAGQVEVDPAVSEALQLVAAHVANLEDILDAEDGLLRTPPEGARPGAIGGPAGSRMTTTDERDRIVWERFQGVRSDVVAKEAPYLGGSGRTIERARIAEAKRRGVKVRPVTGEILGEAA